MLKLSFVALRFESVQISTRLLPIQVLGKQSTSAAFKAKSCERMLQLESNDGIAQSRLRSLMTDMGTESSLWSIPNFSDPSQKYFPYILPIADMDHGLHHCMEETSLAYDNWDLFFKQLSGLSKLFGKRDSLDLFVKRYIWQNDSIPERAKKSLEAMFESACPSLCPHRWLYQYEVIRWLSKRQAFFKYLEPHMIAHDDDMSNEEGNALKRLVAEPKASAQFWATLWVEMQIHSFGFDVYNWLHSCPCHSEEERKQLRQPCPWTGRRLVEIAGGKMNEFHKLISLRLDESKNTMDALATLEQFDLEAVSSLKQSFQTAKHAVALRFRQATSYLTTYPWNIVKILWFFCQQHEAAAARSKAFAAELVGEFDRGLHQKCGEFSRFLDPSEPLGVALRKWATTNDADMDPGLLMELFGYAATLTCMQRLEAKHHLVNQRLSIARNSTPSTLSSNLRRALNSDVQSPNFRENFERYLLEFHKLVDTPWHSRRELARLVSGYHMEIMFRDLSEEQSLISAQVVGNNTGKHVMEWLNHLKSVLCVGEYYGVPTEVSCDGSTNFLLIQLLSFTPARKQYMQKVMKWSDDPDPWFEKVGVVVIGKAVAGPLDGVAVDCDESPNPSALPADFCASFTGFYPTEIDVDTFFKTDPTRICQFHAVNYRTQFAASSIGDLEMENLGISDVTLMCSAWTCNQMYID